MIEGTEAREESVNFHAELRGEATDRTLQYCSKCTVTDRMDEFSGDEKKAFQGRDRDRTKAPCSEGGREGGRAEKGDTLGKPG